MAEQRVTSGYIETGLSFTSASGSRWMKHSVGLDSDFVSGHLDDPAAAKYEELSLMNKLLVVRAVTELSVCRFRQTSKDPDYTPQTYLAWISVIHQLIGDEGLERLGV